MQRERRVLGRSSGFALMAGVVVAGLLAYGLVIGITAGLGRERMLMAAVAAPLALAGLVLLNTRFPLAVLLLPLVALAVPIEVATGTGSTVPAALLFAIALTGVWCASMLVRGWELAASPLNRPLLVFGVICCLSLVWGWIWRDPVVIQWENYEIVQIAALLTVLMSISATLLVGNFLTTTYHLKYFVVMFIVLGGLMTCTQLFRIPEGFLNDRGLWGLWLVAPAYSVLIAQPQMHRYWRIVLGILIIANLYQTMVVNSFWISGWFPSIVTILAITFLHSRRAFAAILILGILGTVANWQFFVSIAESNIADGSLERIEIWQQNWRVVSNHWLLGTGPAGYAIYYMTYYADTARSTHNNYLDILAQFGFVGMLVWLWVCIVGIYEGWKLIHSVPRGFLRTLALMATGGWIGALASMMFGDWVLPFAYNQGITGFKYTVYSWLFLGTLISVRTLLRRGSTPVTITALL